MSPSLNIFIYVISDLFISSLAKVCLISSCLTSHSLLRSRFLICHATLLFGVERCVTSQKKAAEETRPVLTSAQHLMLVKVIKMSIFISRNPFVY